MVFLMHNSVMSQPSCPKCHDCQHFYVTWDNKFPMGCKTFGFKGKQLPSLAVFQSTGQSCCYFESKNARATNGNGESDVLPPGCSLSVTA